MTICLRLISEVPSLVLILACVKVGFGLNKGEEELKFACAHTSYADLNVIAMRYRVILP